MEGEEEEPGWGRRRVTEVQGEGGKGGERVALKVFTLFPPWGVRPFWKCDIWHNRILSASEATSLRERGSFVHVKCWVTGSGA